MFGAADSQDTSGYGGLVTPDRSSPAAVPAALRLATSTTSPTASSAALVGGAASYDEAVERVVVDRGELTLFVRREHLLAVARALRDDPALRFEMCTGVSGVHYPARGRPRAARRLPLPVDHPRRPPGPRSRSPPRRRPAHPVDRLGLPAQRLARARDLGHVRHRVRRPPGAHPHPHARRLARATRSARTTRSAASPSSTRAPPSRRRTSGGRTADDDHEHHMSDQRHLRHRPAPTPAEAAEGAHVFNASGGDWDDLVDEATALHEERIVVNMGPQHPSTHGVLRLILELDGETVTETRAGIGYLHTGIEKNMEFRTWTQGVTFCTRMDYLTPMFKEAAYCLGRREAARHHRPDPRARQHHPRADDGAHPDHLAPGRPRHRRHGDGRHHRHDRRLPRARAHPARSSRWSPACG